MRRLTAPAPLRGSNGISFGPDGRLYVAEFLAGRISAVDVTTGEVETVVAAGGPIQAPDDLAFGADGAMYINDLVPGRVWRRTRAGEFDLIADGILNPNGIAVAGNRLFVNEMIPGGRVLELFPGGGAPVTLTEGLAIGNAMQIGPDGYLYYPHMLTGEVHRIHPDGGAPELVADEVHEPVAVRFDRDGALLVLSRDAAGTLTRIDGDRRTIVATGVTGMDNAAFDDDNRMFVSSFAQGGITEFHPDGRNRDVVVPGHAGPFGITVDLAGTVHTADHYRVGAELRNFAHAVAADSGRLHVSSQYGFVKTIDGASERVRVTGLQEPTDLIVRPDGTLLITEAGAGRVVSLDENDTVAVITDRLGRPAGITLDAEQRCYVTDTEHGTVSRLDDGIPQILADGLDQPQGVAVLGDDLYVLERGRRRLLAISLSGGEPRIAAEDLPLGPRSDRRAALFADGGMPGVPRPFAGLAAGPDGTLYLSADGEGTVLAFTFEEPR
ncbi:MAG TPA: hypothetical protein VN408_00705 [Actinoplanes sp.]|nr:hypothetical protein [Actinoplanes sp.]